MNSRPVIILCALTREAKAIERAWRVVRRRTGGRIEFEPEVRVIGVRGSRLGRIARPSNDAAVIVAGLAGGLGPALPRWTVVLDDEAGEVENDPGDVHIGRIMTSTEVLATPEAKRAAWQASGAACVDMEQGVVAAWLGRPVVGVRVVFDDANTALPEAITRISNDVGGVRVGALAKYLVTNARGVPRLMELGRQSSNALTVLGGATVLIASLVGRPRAN
ncbi:MAG: hypothetical protein GC200_03250 [Tepidisphaera sp.]|nr:hypothetical protein [Tepidisphaera sp.]